MCIYAPGANKLSTVRDKYKIMFGNNPVFATLLIVLAAVTGIEYVFMFVPRSDMFHEILTSDSNKVFLDFFDSVMYSMDRPYTQYSVIYPPFITVIYGLIGNATVKYVSHWGGENLAIDLRYSQECMMVFMVLTLISIVLLHIYLQHSMKNLPVWQTNCIFFLILLSSPVMFAIDRGNNVLYCVLFCLLFIQGYNSENKLIRLISYLGLGIAVSIKVCPIFFGLLILRERQYKRAFVCFVIITSIFFTPFVFTDGGPAELIRNIQNFEHGKVAEGLFKTIYYSMEPLVRASFILAAVLLIWFDKNIPYWQQLFLICGAMLTCVGFDIIYNFCFCIVFLVYFIKTETTLTFFNVCNILCIVGILLPFPSFMEIKTICFFIMFLILLYGRASEWIIPSESKVKPE